MSNPQKHEQQSVYHEGVINIAVGILATIFTCGIYGLVWQYQQMKTLNHFLGREEYNFLMWFLLTIVTCGIFAMYYEYKMAEGINEIKMSRGMMVDTNLPVMCVLLAIFQLGIVSMAIQQGEINRLCNASADY